MRLDFGLAEDVLALEDNPRIDGSGLQRERDRRRGMQGGAANGSLAQYCSLFHLNDCMLFAFGDS